MSATKISMIPIFRCAFVVLCVFATISMISYWAYKFSLDHDISVITYQKFFEREEDIYPTVSICLQNPFLKQRLAEYGVDHSLYLKYLKGEYFSEDMLNIDYRNVTIDISRYIKGYKMYLRNGSIIEVEFDSGLNMKEKRMLIHVSYNGFNDYGRRFRKCFGLDIPKIQGLHTFRILLSNNIFPNGERPTYHDFKAVYHLPNQYILAGENTKYVWPYRAANESYKTRFQIGEITIVRKRNKQEHRCIESCNAYDNWVMKFTKNDIKCNIPYLQLDKELPVCKSKEQIKRGMIIEGIAERNNLIKPCKTMENINVQHIESTMTSNNTSVEDHTGEFWFSVTIKNPTFKEIEQKRYPIRFLKYYTKISIYSIASIIISIETAMSIFQNLSGLLIFTHWLVILVDM